MSSDIMSTCHVHSHRWPTVLTNVHRSAQVQHRWHTVLTNVHRSAQVQPVAHCASDRTPLSEGWAKQKLKIRFTLYFSKLSHLWVIRIHNWIYLLTNMTVVEIKRFLAFSNLCCCTCAERCTFVTTVYHRCWTCVERCTFVSTVCHGAGPAQSGVRTLAVCHWLWRTSVHSQYYFFTGNACEKQMMFSTPDTQSS